jgi:putative FmdB family regulatory protein
MIRYEYECQACGKISEFLQSIHEKPKRKCRECRKLKLERLISGGCHAYTDPGVTTLGKLAEVNSKKQGKEITEKRSAKLEQQKEAAGIKKVDDVDRKIWKMNDDQKMRYIMDGTI